ncbi:DUF5673 domain-containing protein [Sporosarcina sp. Marseille-Q4943]|uniref:DUF5673 domain-containing protein n=1 Tax=Sporosarcina sp. Marseille-Q4943 TaxID=2942204 RepID=UPI00208DBA5F|nr:DUF5673 domain-containing protein [Sporosarcina sp. Marseille-Q4943]
MKILTNILFLLLLGYLCFRFIRLIIKLKRPAVFPITEEDLKAIRRQPQKAVNLPVISEQKSGFFVMGVTLLGLLLLAVFKLQDSTIQTPYLIIPLVALINFNQSWNLFAIVEDGVLCGGRFVPWKRIQSYQFEQIDTNHRFYGYSPEVNSGYELKISTRFFEVGCIVTSEERKEKLTKILDARLS